MPESPNSMSFLAIGSIRVTDEQTYETWVNNFLPFTALLGINPHDVEGFAKVDDNYLIQGDFNIQDIRDWLNYADYDIDVDNELLGTIEVWEGIEDIETALMKGLVIHGEKEYVRDCIKVIQGERNSLYNNEGVKDVAQMVKNEASFILNLKETYKGQEYSGLLLSAQLFDHSTMEYAEILIFENELAAKNAFEEIEEGTRKTSEDEWQNLKITMDSKFIILTNDQPTSFQVSLPSLN